MVHDPAGGPRGPEAPAVDAADRGLVSGSHRDQSSTWSPPSPAACGRFPSAAEGGATWFGIIGDTNAPVVGWTGGRLFEDTRPADWAVFRQPGGLHADAENLEWLVQTPETLKLPLERSGAARPGAALLRTAGAQSEQGLDQALRPRRIRRGPRRHGGVPRELPSARSTSARHHRRAGRGQRLPAPHRPGFRQEPVLADLPAGPSTDGCSCTRR